MIIAVYPGSFDPITNGHLDIAIRAARLFDKLIIGVYDTSDKRILFSTAERVDLVKRTVTEIPNIDVTSFSNLTVEFARDMGAKALVRGLRMVTDFEREFEMTQMNRKLYPNLEIVCLMTGLQYQFLSSSLLKEVAGLGGDITNMVPEHVAVALKKKLGNE